MSVRLRYYWPLLLLATACGGNAGERVVLGTTHTLEDSGLLEALAEAYDAEPGHAPLSIIVAGSGEILAMAERGDIDVVLSHSPEAEMSFIERGAATEREEVMRSEFVLLGPPADPARLDTLDSAVAAFRRIAERARPFVSRGDDSGTHARERSLWESAGVTPAWPGYIEAGAGMADALRVASQRGAFILSDRPTFERLRDQLRLEVVLEGDPRLTNPYSVIVVTGARNRDGAQHFARWIRSERTQRLIGDFGLTQTRGPLFMPFAADSLVS